MTIPASVIVMTKNEEANVCKCLASVSDFAEVFVVDSESTDRTAELAATYPNTKVVTWRWNGQFPKKKQWCLENLPFSHSWVLYLDADEEVTPELRDEIARWVGKPGDYVGFFVKYDYYFMQRRLRWGDHPVKLILFQHQKGRFDPANELLISTMWEVEGGYQPLVDGRVGSLRNHAVHNDYKTLYSFFARHNRYSDLEAYHRMYLHGVKESYPSWRRWLKKVGTSFPGSGLLFFCYSYFLRLGFLDGRPGLAFSLAKLSYYTEVDCKRMELDLVPEIVQRHYCPKPSSSQPAPAAEIQEQAP